MSSRGAVVCRKKNRASAPVALQVSQQPAPGPQAGRPGGKAVKGVRGGGAADQGELDRGDSKARRLRGWHKKLSAWWKRGVS
ncbi:hypothetical protein kuro4_26390 [Gelria sp. Kuro-4]|nr:hypothetical protein kuro4_26390 [Gelria sp. Kuro-4]